MGFAAQDLEQVVGSVDAAVAGPPGVVPVEYLVVPCEEGVDGVAELGDLPGAVDVREPVERFEGAVAVVGEVQVVQLAERFPRGPQPGVGSEQLVEPFLLGIFAGGGARRPAPPMRPPASSPASSPPGGVWLPRRPSSHGRL